MLGFASLCEAPLSTLSGDAIRLESSALLDSNFILESTLSARYFPQQILTIDTNLLLDAVNRSNISSNLITQFDLAINSLIRTSGSSAISIDTSIQTNNIIKILNDILIQSNIDMQLSSFIKTVGSSNLPINFLLEPVLSNTSFNSADLEIVMAFQSNFSQVNGDIVYYIVYTDKIKPFNMTIARVK
jgi:hypothetical protein